MSKGEGLKIGIKFTEDLVGDISPPIAVFETQDGDWTAEGTYGSFAVNGARDRDTSSYWQSRLSSNYIQITRPNTKLLGFKVYKGSSYSPRSFTLRTSSDGVTYSDVKSGSFIATTGWETIMFNEPVISDYFRISFGYSSRLYLHELVLIVEGYDNEAVNDFIITGKEYLYINGPLVDKRYKVSTYERHPNELNSILLTMDWWGRFNNVEGNLTVKYDASKGSLSGRGGAVESFTEAFTPTDLVPKPNPGVAETIINIPSINTAFTKVVYNSRHASDCVVAKNLSITVVFTNVDEVNP